MLHYYVNEAAFALPARPFVDRTLQRLTAPLAGSEEQLTVEIRRLPMVPDKSLRQRVEEELAAARTTQDGFTVVETVEAVLDTAPALLLRTRRRKDDAVWLRLEAHVAFNGVWLSFVVSGPSSHRAQCEQTFDRLINGLRWRKA